MVDATWRAVEQVMGLPISVALRGRHAGSPAAVRAWEAALAELRAVDRDYSAYREDSWLSRHNRGEEAPRPAGLEEVLDLAARARVASGGAFDIRRDGVLDLDGVVKGWAVERASRHLRELGDTDFCLSGGGDMVCWTATPDGRPWRVGVEHPRTPQRLLATIPVRRGAVATSGTAHRGAHIVDARSGRPAVGGPVSVTVVGDDLTWVDIEATAAFARGGDAVRWLRSRPGRAGVVVWVDGTVETWESAGAA